MIFLMQSVPLDLFLHLVTMQRSWDGLFLLHSEKTSIRGTPGKSIKRKKFHFLNERKKCVREIVVEIL